MKTNLYRNNFSILITGICFIAVFTNDVGAINTQIQTDNTLSGISAIDIDSPGAGHTYTLSEINGKTAGNNLFFSFSNFDIGTADTAWFNLNTPDLVNVISRVTGGVESLIDGQLKMTNVSSVPSFFFINPAGITFFAGASVDVPGSFYVSTASGLNMSDGGVYDARESQASTLSAADPESFGFLGDESGSINIGSLESNTTTLTFKPGTDAVFVGNQIRINNASLINTDLTQAGLDLQLIATGNSGTNITFNILPDHATAGDITINNARLFSGADRIAIRSDNFDAIDSRLFVTNYDNVPMSANQGIDVQVHFLNFDHTIIDSSTSANDRSGNILLKAEKIELTNMSSIDSASNEGSKGDSGVLLINAEDLIINDAIVSTTTLGEGNASDVTVKADSLSLINNGGILSISGGHGNAGSITVIVDSVNLANTGQILSATSEDSTSNSGKIAIQARELTINNGIISSRTLGGGNAGEVTVNTDLLQINNDTSLDRGIFSSTIGGGDSSNVIINARELEINNGFITSGVFGDKGKVGNVTVTANSLKISGGSISSNSITNDDSGAVTINAGQLVMDNEAIISSDTIGDGNAGNVDIKADYLIIENSGSISSDTHLGQGDAGNVSVSANTLILKSNGSISSKSLSDASGNGGTVTINAQQLELNDGLIISSTFGEGNAGAINITADTLFNHDGSILSSALGDSKGDAGAIAIMVKQLEVNRGVISAGTDSVGDAGNVTINADSVNLHNDGGISADTTSNSEGHGGSVTINAKDLEIDDSFVTSRTRGKGNAGAVTISVDVLTLSNNGAILSSSGNGETQDTIGDAGLVFINAQQLNISNAFIANETFGRGNAGQIIIDADTLQLTENGFISSSTLGSGHAGDITITAGSLSAHGTGLTVFDLSSNELTGVFSRAGTKSSGQTGNIVIDARNDIRLVNGAQISITNEAIVDSPRLLTLTPTVINIEADSLFLTDSHIAADSIGNVDSGGIFIHVTDQLFLDPSTISTQANNGNGGAIIITSGDVVYLLDSAITTSVSGQMGNGGDINITSNNVVLDSGFVQANTEASSASGGEINVKAQTLLPSGNSLFVGGSTPFEFQPFSGLNVIQAAAPDGVNGSINSATPQLNLSSILTNLVVESFDPNALNRSMCTVDESSSLFQSGKGGRRIRTNDFLLSPVF